MRGHESCSGPGPTAADCAHKRALCRNPRAARQQLAVPLLVPMLEYQLKVRARCVVARRRGCSVPSSVCSSAASAGPGPTANASRMPRHPAHACRGPGSQAGRAWPNTWSQVDLLCLQPELGADDVRLAVVAGGGGVQGGGRAPLMSALVRMPLSEPEEVRS